MDNRYEELDKKDIYDMNEEELREYIKSINLMVGAMDGKTIKKVKKLCGDINRQNWAIQRLRNLMKFTDRDDALSEMENVLSKMRDDRHD